MPDPEDYSWIKATANELNNLLQVISESSEVIAGVTGDSPDTAKYFAILRSGIQRASQVTQAMAERAGGYQSEVSSADADSKDAASPAAAAAATGATDLKIFNPTGPKELVMIVDDEDLVTLLAQRVLTEEGYRIITAKDGFQAISTYRKLKEQIALIILDFTMPIMDGADVFAELLLINPNVPVVLSSGFAEQERLRGMLARGLRGFIPKPYTQQKLLTQIRSTLDALRVEQGERRIF